MEVLDTGFTNLRIVKPRMQLTKFFIAAYRK